jgi:hypothetical protein
MANKVTLDTADKLDIVCKKGDTFLLNLRLKDSDGVPMELSTLGYAFLMQVREQPVQDPASVEPALIKGPVVISTPDAKETRQEEGQAPTTNLTFEPIVVDDSGNVTITGSHNTMKQIPAGRYVYDIQSVVSGTYKTIVRGGFIVNDDITVV